LALTFYVPQLLSFLIHGAYDNATELEHLVLQNCRRNIHFAHRCYWFLRAWCIEGSHDEQASQLQNVSMNASQSTQITADLSQHPQQYQIVIPEDRTVMQGLLQRVVECGEVPAQLLEFGDGIIDAAQMANLESARIGFGDLRSGK